MAVVLTILKVIGIILLVLLALAVLLLLLVLIVPIRYRVAGSYNEEDILADLKIRWLFVKVLGHFRKDESLQIKAKVAFVTVFSREMKMGKNKEQHLVDVSEEATLPPPEDSGGTDFSAADSGGTNSPPESESVPQENVQQDAGKAEEEQPGNVQDLPPENQEAAEEPEKNARKKKKKADKKKEELPEPDDMEEALEGEVESDPMEKLEQFREKLEVKKRHIEQFLAREHTKNTIQRLKKLLLKILKHLKPKKGHVDLVLGLGSAADTGMILGKAAMFYPLYGKWLFITPDFYYKRIEAEGEVKGRIRIGSLVMPALFFIIRKDTRRTIKLAKKI